MYVERLRPYKKRGYFLLKDVALLQKRRALSFNSCKLYFDVQDCKTIHKIKYLKQKTKS